MVDNYDIYIFSKKEQFVYLLQGIILIGLLGHLFYRSYLGIMCLSPMIWLYYRMKRKDKVAERRWQLNLEFRDGINSVLAALSAGYSAENAFDEALKDLQLIYKKDSLIVQEIQSLVNKIHMSITVEEALFDFGERSKIEDIQNFSEVFSTAKRTGGDLIWIIRNTCNTISEKLEVKSEIITMITAKRYEAGIMKLIPPGIIGFLMLTSPGFLDPLYHNILGVVIMSFLLAIYLSAFLLINKIVSIEI